MLLSLFYLLFPKRKNHMKFRSFEWIICWIMRTCKTMNLLENTTIVENDDFMLAYYNMWIEYSTRIQECLANCLIEESFPLINLMLCPLSFNHASGNLCRHFTVKFRMPIFDKLCPRIMPVISTHSLGSKNPSYWTFIP